MKGNRMDNITIRFGTPEPIYYREMDLEMGLDMDVLYRVADLCMLRIIRKII